MSEDDGNGGQEEFRVGCLVPPDALPNKGVLLSIEVGPGQTDKVVG